PTLHISLFLFFFFLLRISSLSVYPCLPLLSVFLSSFLPFISSFLPFLFLSSRPPLIFPFVPPLFLLSRAERRLFIFSFFLSFFVFALD
ncbi:hypothetical protein CSUI_008542, partial [Cystoisospora suis]